MKQALLIISTALILFTTACAAAMLIPAAVVLHSSVDGDSQETKVAENVPASDLKKDPGTGTAHISGALKPRLHVSGGASQGNHISGRSFNHISGGIFY